MWSVTRQSQWPEGDLVVEISAGDINYSNPGALVEKYPGEFGEFHDPREAVKTAIKIAQAWQKDCPKETIKIALGNTGGYTMPFEGEELTEETFARLIKWADDTYETLPKCARCGDLIEGDAYVIYDMPDEKFCREYCAEEAEREYQIDQIKFQVENMDEVELREVLIKADYELDDTDTEESMRKLVEELALSGEIQV